MQKKWDKTFWARGYCVSTIGNITEDDIKKYTKEQAEESRKDRYKKYRFISGPVATLAISALLGEHVIGPY